MVALQCHVEWSLSPLYDELTALFETAAQMFAQIEIEEAKEKKKTDQRGQRSAP